MRFNFVVLLFLLLIPSTQIIAQTVSIEGYTYESDNRGYIKEVDVTVYEKDTKVVLGQTKSDRNGKFSFSIPVGKEFKIRGSKKLFEDTEVIVSSKNKTDGGKVFAKIVMYRKPGYIFDVTVAKKRIGNEPTDAVVDTKVEIYNNTLKQEDLVIENNPAPTFNHTFEQGNHYTVMIRKEGFMTKRMEAYVNVKGCILCFDGIGDVRPGVTDNLTEGNKMGTLLANVELIPINLNEGIKIDNIYYNYNSSEIREDAKKELDKLIQVLRDNPSLDIELGSHTDARGKATYNSELSQKRAQSAVDYITTKGDISANRIVAKGYGESQILNKCKDGIDCDERMHEQNRRTELKITGIRNNKSISDKSLAQILHEENMGKMLEEVVNSEEIKIPEGGTLPDEIAASMSNPKSRTPIETQPKSYDNPVTTNSKGGTISMESSAVKPSPISTISQLEGAITPASPSTTSTSTPAPTPASNSSVRDDNHVYKPQDADKKKGSSQSNLYQPTESVQATAEDVDNYGMVVRIVDANGNTVRNGQKGKELHAYQVFQHNRATIDHYKNSVTKYKRRVMPTIMSMGYTGYKIQIEKSGGELPISHEIFGRHGNISYDVTKEGNYSYMLGDFAESKDAMSFFTEIIRPQYPHARVIQYKDGNRLNE